MVALQPGGTIARRWARVGASTQSLAPGYSLTRAYRLAGDAQNLPLLSQPCVYMVIDGYRVLYVGQTRDLRRRFVRHLCDVGRRERWLYVAVLPLRADVGVLELDRIENLATRVLKPSETIRTPRVRATW